MSLHFCPQQTLQLLDVCTVLCSTLAPASPNHRHGGQQLSLRESFPLPVHLSPQPIFAAQLYKMPWSQLVSWWRTSLCLPLLISCTNQDGACCSTKCKPLSAALHNRRWRQWILTGCLHGWDLSSPHEPTVLPTVPVWALGSNTGEAPGENLWTSARREASSLKKLSIVHAQITSSLCDCGTLHLTASPADNWVTINKVLWSYSEVLLLHFNPSIL